MKILMVKASNCRDVRLQKYKEVLSGENDLEFVGWDRFQGEDEIFLEKFNKVSYILSGWSSSKVKILTGTFIWFFLLTFYILKNKYKYEIIYCADFEAAFPIWVAKKIGIRVVYIYDIYDEVELRYNYGWGLKKILKFIDKSIKKDSLINIYVDKIRLDNTAGDEKSVIIENSPLDFYNGNYKKNKVKKTFVVSGYLTKMRGMESIYEFAKNKIDYKFIVVGRFNDEGLKRKILSLSNVEFYEFMPQKKLFELIKDSFAIFSLYDPTVEINLKAASNKLYDSLMLGIPVIVNEEIYASKFVENNLVGVCVPYFYDKEKWDYSFEKLEGNLDIYSASCRKLFEEKYDFEGKVKHVFSFK